MGAVDVRAVQGCKTFAAAVVAACLLMFGVASGQDAPESRPEDAQRREAKVNRLLDEPLALNLETRPLPEVLEAITEATKVPFLVEETTYALLPYGRETPISVTVNGTPLRQTMAAITRRLGLEPALRDERVELRPVPALRRAGRRATVQEIALLDLLAGARLDLVEDQLSAAQLLEAIDLKLQDLDAAAKEAGRQPPGFAVENRLEDRLREQPVFVRRDATLLEAMEAVETQTGGTWFPSGDTVVTLPKEAWVKQMLERPVTLAYDRVGVGQVLADLERAAGVPFRIEPGALQRVPTPYRAVRLFLENQTVREALESLGGETGLGYAADGAGVIVYHEDGPSGRRRGFGAQQQAGDQPVLMVDLGDGTSLLIYASELPRDVRERLEARREAAIESIRAAAREPATLPDEE
jgi:hypothetical protein